MSHSVCQEGEATLVSDPVFSADAGKTCELVPFVDQLMSELHADGVAIAIYLPPDTDHLMCVVSRGELAPPLSASLDVNSGISGRCIRENRMLHSYDTRLDPRVDEGVCERMGIRSLAVTPLHRDSRCIGVLSVFSQHPAAFEGPTLNRFAEAAILVTPLIPLGFESKQAALAETDQTSGSENGSEKELANEVADAQRQFIFRSLEIQGPSRISRFARRSLPWLAASAAAVIVGVAAPQIAARINRSLSIEKKIDRTVIAATRRQAEQSAAGAAEHPGRNEALEKDKSGPAKRSLLADAEAGDPIAQFFLSVHYLNGSGADQDIVKAATWSIMAGLNGNQAAKEAVVEITRNLTPQQIADTRFQIGKMFLNGIGAARDPVAAYSWFALAKAAGDPRAGKEIKELSKTMTREQISEAHLQVAHWFPQRPVKPQVTESQVSANTTPAQ